LMLYIDPSLVDMTKAVKDYHPHQAGGLSRDPNKPGTYSASGIYGDATLATREKGEIMAKAMLEDMLREIQELRSTPR
jgi:creatinine amidohydrolase